MPIGDLIFSLMGQPDPRQQLAAALAGPNSVNSSSPTATAAAFAPPNGTAAPANGQLLQLVGADPNTPPVPAGPASPQPAAPPLPQAYQSPPDMTKMYLDLMNRQSANEGIDRGMGLLFGAFASPEDRGPMLQAMTGQTPDATSLAGNLIALQQNAMKMQQQRTLLAQLPTLAKQLNLPIEQVQAAAASGALDDILKASYVSGTPLNHAQVQKAVAEAAEATRKTQAQTDLLNSSSTLAAQYGIPEPQVRSLISSGGWDNFAIEHQKALDTNAALTPEEKQYRAVKADNDARGVATPTFGDWLKTGASGGTKMFGQVYPRVVTDSDGKPITNSDGSPKVEMVQLSDRPGVAPQVVQGLQPKPERIDTGTTYKWVVPLPGGGTQVVSEVPKDVPGEAAQKAQGAATGAFQGEAKDKLESTVSSIEDSNKKVQDVLDDPNLNNRLGNSRYLVPGLVPKPVFPGSDDAATESRIQQAIGLKTLAAAEALKGAGAYRAAAMLVNSAAPAMSRLASTNMGTADYKHALQDVIDINNRAIAQAYDEAKLPRPDRYKDVKVTSSDIPQAAVDALKANPDRQKEFDAKFGDGAAARVLGQ